MVLPSGAVALRDEFKGTMDAWMAALEAFADIPARRRIAVFGEISEVTGNQEYRDIGQRLVSWTARSSWAPRRTCSSFAPGPRQADWTMIKSPTRATHIDVIDLLRDELGEGDVVLIQGRWQQALGRVGLALAGEDVQCRADPCPFKRMLCDVCPMLKQRSRKHGRAQALGRAPRDTVLPSRLRSVEVPDASAGGELVNEATALADHHHQLVAGEAPARVHAALLPIEVVLAHIRHLSDCLAFCSACSQVMPTSRCDSKSRAG